MRGIDGRQAGGSYLGSTDPYRDSSLEAITTLLEISDPRLDHGWTAESARLFAIDCAMIPYRKRLDRMSAAEQRLFNELTREARRLTTQLRQYELEFIQQEIVRLIRSQTTRQAREAWLVAADALLASPFRAAQVAPESVLMADGRKGGSDREVVVFRLRERLVARTIEAIQDDYHGVAVASDAEQIALLRAARFAGRQNTA